MVLPCTINREECGDFHSIKWYKENRRVFVYSPIADFARAEGELQERGQLLVDSETSDANLRIKDVRTSDEGEYKCEITFLDITKNCPVVQLVKLTTLGEHLNSLFNLENVRFYSYHQKFQVSLCSW